MAQSTVESWNTFLLKAGIPDDDAATYAAALVEHRISDHHDFSKEVLKEIGINKIGDILNILKFSRKPETTQTGEPRPLSGGSHPERPILSKPPTASAPLIKAEMTNPEFRKLKVDWGVFKSLTRLPTTQLAAQIYTSCDSSVQTSIINSTDNFFALDENEIFKLLEKVVTKRSNPSVHRLGFSNITQSEGEPVKDFVVRLKSCARDCEFACPNCSHDLIPTNVKDQLIRGLHNSTLQTDILAKSDTLKNLDDIIKHAESFEAAIDDQSKLKDASEVMGARTTEYRRMQQSRLNGKWSNQQPPASTQPAPKHTPHQQRGPQVAPPRRRPCPGCGSTNGHSSRDECPAWGQKCHNCDFLNHYAKVCRQPRRSPASNPASNPPQRDSASAGWQLPLPKKH